MDAPPLTLRFDAFELDEGNARLCRGTVPVEITPKAFAVLCALGRTPGRLLTKDALLDAVWGHRHVSESALKSTISQLRAALGDDARQPRYIETVSRRGYRLVGGSDTATPAPAETPPDMAPGAAGLASAALPVVGRQAELARLLGCWQAATEQRRQIVWVAGEAGIGKSTLIDLLVERAGETFCARGQCVEPYGAGEPYLPVLDALAAVCRRDAALPALMRRVAPTWLLQMPWLVDPSVREALQREAAGASQDRMLREMGELLDRYTEHRPLLLVTEDLHWSDDSTVRLLNHLARRRTASRLLWIGSFRSAELVAGDHPLKAVRQELRTHRLCQEIALEPLSERDVGDYLGRRFPRAPPSEAFVRALHAHTDGLPLFLVNVLDHFVGTDDRAAAPTVDARIDELRRFVPDDLAGMIESKFDRQPAETRALLAAASVCGMVFRPSILADVLGCDPGELAQRCDALARSHNWLAPRGTERCADGTLEPSYGFTHALYRHVLHQKAAPGSGARLHRRIGDAIVRAGLAGAGVPHAELAMHFEHGGDLPRAVEHCAAAAGHAMAMFAPREAHLHAVHGLSLLARCPADDSRHAMEVGLLTARGIAATQLQGVASPEVIETLERARLLCERLPSSVERTWILSGLGWVYYSRGAFADAIALGHLAAERAQATGDRMLQLAACNLIGVALANSGHLDDARRALEEGIALSVALADSIPSGRFVVDPEVSMRANLCVPLFHLGLTDAARAQGSAAQRRAAAIGQPIARLLANWCQCMVEIHLGDIERVRVHAQALAEVVDRHAVAQGQGPGRWYGGWVRMRDGDPRGGHAQILEGYECHARLGMDAGGPCVLGYAAEALALAGDADGARRQIDGALALAGKIGESLELPSLLLLRARLEAAAGDLAPGRQTLREALECARRNGATRFIVEVLLALCRVPGTEPRDGRALAEALSAVPEGFDEGLRERAREVLARA